VIYLKSLANSEPIHSLADTKKPLPRHTPETGPVVLKGAATRWWLIEMVLSESLAGGGGDNRT